MISRFRSPKAAKRPVMQHRRWRSRSTSQQRRCQRLSPHCLRHKRHLRCCSWTGRCVFDFHGNGLNNCNNQDQNQQQQQQQKRSSRTYVPNDDVRELDSDYKDVFMRRLLSDMQAEGIPLNDLRRRFGLTKESLDTLLPEYKLLLNRFDKNLYRYAQEALTARYMQSMRIDSDTVIQTSSASHKLVEVEPKAPEAAQAQLAAHGLRWQDVIDQRLHKAGRSQLDSVMELIRAEDRPVTAFNDSQLTAPVSSEADGDPVQTGDRDDGAGGGGGGGGGADGSGVSGV